jgi:hypothetical protein
VLTSKLRDWLLDRAQIMWDGMSGYTSDEIKNIKKPTCIDAAFS